MTRATTTELQGTIGPVQRSEDEDRGHVRVPYCWIECEASADQMPLPGTALGTLPALENWTDTAGRAHALLVLLAENAPQYALQVIRHATSASVRTYVLADTSIPELDQRLGNGNRHLLIRRVHGVPTTAVLARRGQRAGLFIGANPERPEMSWWLGLVPTQGQALFLDALRLFWHHATDEAWADGRPLQFSTPRPRPFDVPIGALDADILLTDAPLTPRIDDHAGDSVWVGPDGSLPTGRVTTILVPHGPAAQEALKDLAGTSRVLWRDLGLPTLYMGRQSGSLVLATPQWSMRVRLHPEQVERLRALTNIALELPRYRFAVNIALSDIRSDVWLPYAKAAMSPQSQVELQCPEVHAEQVRGMAQLSQPSRPEPPVLAQHVVWNWTVRPPVAPRGAKPDPLVDRWAQLDRRYEERLADVNKQLEKLAEREGLLTRTFDTLESELLGFGRKRSNLQKTVSTLSPQIPSRRGPQLARDDIAALIELERALAQLIGDVDDAQGRAERKREEAQQRSQFDEQQQEARKTHDDHMRELERRQAEYDRADAELTRLQDNPDGRSDRDVRAGRRKFKDERKKAEKRIKRLRGMLKEQQAVLEQEFELRPVQPVKSRKRGGGASFVPKPSRPQHAGPEVPKDALPGVGQLLRHKNRRYLAIRCWEELDEGEREASRLLARLVATRER